VYSEDSLAIATEEMDLLRKCKQSFLLWTIKKTRKLRSYSNLSEYTKNGQLFAVLLELCSRPRSAIQVDAGGLLACGEALPNNPQGNSSAACLGIALGKIDTEERKP
jgi:hypothetical protein